VLRERTGLVGDVAVVVGRKDCLELDDGALGVRGLDVLRHEPPGVVRWEAVVDVVGGVEGGEGVDPAKAAAVDGHGVVILHGRAWGWVGGIVDAVEVGNDVS
jgi:hypothetical protein